MLKKNYYICFFTICTMPFNAQAALFGNGKKLADGSCQFEKKEGFSTPMVYVNEKGEAYYTQRLANARYDDMEEVYDMTNCKLITSGVAEKSNFATVMRKNNFQQIATNKNLLELSQGLTSFIDVKNDSASNNISLKITKTPSEQLNAMNSILNFLNGKTDNLPINDLNAIKDSPLLTTPQYRTFIENYAYAIPLSYSLKSFQSRANSLMQLKNSFPATSELGKLIVNTIYPVVTNQAQTTLVRATIPTQNDFNQLFSAVNNIYKQDNGLDFREGYRKAELLLINKIKDKLISFDVNMLDGTTKYSTWHLNSLFGRTTDESSVEVKSFFDYKSSINKDLFSPNLSYTVKASLVALIDYQGNKSRSKTTTLMTSRLGGDSISDKGTCTLDWQGMYAGAGSFVKNESLFNAYTFVITDLTVE